MNLKLIRYASFFIWTLLLFTGLTQNRLFGQTYPRVINTGMVTPRVLCIEIQDATITKTANHDLFEGRRMNRNQLDNKNSYTVTRTNGPAPSIERLWRKSRPWGVSHRPTPLNEAPDGIDDQVRSPFRHQIYFKFDRVIANGEKLRITFADADIGQVEFDFWHKWRNSPTIHVNQHGWRGQDPAKWAFLSFWSPSGYNYGIYNIKADFPNATIPNFKVVRNSDRSDTGISGPVVLRKSPYSTNSEGKPDWYETRPNGSGEIAYTYDPGAIYGIGNPLPNEDFWTVKTGGSVTAVRLNPSKTFVYAVDLSDLTETGTYRVFIPGLGVSQPFEVRNRIWKDVAAKAIHGNYAHRRGCPINSSVGGYGRPAAFPDGTDFFVANVPYIFHAESPINGFKKIGIDQAYDLYGTTTKLPDAWGGWMDAGDWDARIQHYFVSYMMLDLYEMMPNYFDNSSNQFGIPAANTLLPDPVSGGNHDYANLPGLLDEAVWGLDWWMRNQITSGSDKGAIYPAIEHADFSNSGVSWNTTSTAYVCKPDPYSNYAYAALAAKAAIVLAQFDPDLQSKYRQSAIDAYEWAEANAWNGGSYSDGSPGSVKNSTMQWLVNYYNAHVFPGNPSARNAEIDKARNKISSAMKDARAGAAGALYRLTGESKYSDDFTEASKLQNNGNATELLEWQDHGAWELVLTGNTSHPLYDEAFDSIIRTGDEFFVEPSLSRYGFANARHAWTQLDWGNGVVPRQGAFNVVRAAMIDPAQKLDYIGYMGTSLSFVLGGNQANLSFMKGIGDNQVRWILHADSLEDGKEAPDGISLYGFGFILANRWGSLFNAEPWSDLYDRYHFEAGKVVETSRSIHPKRTDWPVWELSIEHPGYVSHAEYTIMQMAPMIAFSTFLDNLAGGNTIPPMPPAGYLNVPDFSSGGGSGSAVKINIGNGGTPSGWENDNAYIGGAPNASGTSSSINVSGVSNPAPQSVYQKNHWKNGTYSITVPGLNTSSEYLVRLHLAENFFNGANQRKFHVDINGSRVLTNFDIYAEAGGKNKAVVEEFLVNSASSIQIEFKKGSTDNPSANGVEIIEQTAGVPTPGGTSGPKTTVVKMDATNGTAPSGWVDENPYITTPKSHSNTGATIGTSGVVNPAPQNVYKKEQYRIGATLGYEFDGLNSGKTHVLRLHFAEAYFNSSNQRRFHVDVNGTRVYTNLDIYSEAGGKNKAVVRQVTVPPGSSTISVELKVGSKNNPKINGIEVQQVN
ncbi:MAG: malectin domain-containing carbohydrate-binding protein [Verrucomicrobiota bacterium]